MAGAAETRRLDVRAAEPAHPGGLLQDDILEVERLADAGSIVLGHHEQQVADQ